jgi:hypothetical protein
MWTTCPRSAASGYHADFHEGCYQKHTNSLNRRTSSSDISGRLSRRTEHCRRMAGARNGMGTAWTRHGMCELASTLSKTGSQRQLPFCSRLTPMDASVIQPCCAAGCCGEQKSLSERCGRSMSFVNQTRPHCVNQMGKTIYKPIMARHGRGTGWARHRNGVVRVN